MGHAFVAWARENHDRVVSESHAFGLYPQNSKTAAFGAVPGEIVAEVSKENFGQNAHNLVVRVTRFQYEQAERIRHQWARQREYNLLDRDCVTFLTAVADSVPIRTPPRSLGTLRPAPFVVKLMELN